MTAQITLTSIHAGFARVLLDGQDIGFIEKREHVGQITQGSGAWPVSRQMWSFTPASTEWSAAELNSGPRHIAGGFTTRRAAIDA